jgi:probable HAF family extracellular repeat protein
MKSVLVVLVLSLVAILASCGVGAVSTSTSTPPVVQTPSPQPPPPTPTPPVPPPPATPAKHYRLVDLVPLPGADASQANAIAKDHAAGYSVFGGFFGFPRVTVWQSDGTPEDLGVTGIGQAINSQGEVVGVVTDTATPQAFLWNQGMVTQLGTLPGFDSSIATGINDSGEVVGIAYVFANPNNEVGFKWTQATGMQAIDSAATAGGVNARGDIAGMSLGMHATIFSASGNIDLGTLGDFSLAGAVNNQGHAAGIHPSLQKEPCTPSSTTGLCKI